MKATASAVTAAWLVALLGLSACRGGSPQGAVAPQAAQAAAPSDESILAPPRPEAAPSKELLAGIKAFDAGHFAEARVSFETAAKKDAANYEAFNNLGIACERLGDKPAAEAAYKSALSLKPDLEAVSVGLSALTIDQGRFDDAAEIAKAGLVRHPSSAALHENLGAALAAKGEKEAAAKELDEATRLSPNDPMLHLTLAHYLNAWQASGAREQLDAASALAKDDYALIASIGHEYRMAAEFAACVKTFDRAIARKDGGEVRTERALCHLGLKDPKGALDDLQGALTAEPRYAPAHYYLGGRLATQGRYKDAAGEYAKYLKLEPTGSLARQAAERMKGAEDAAKGGHKTGDPRR